MARQMVDLAGQSFGKLVALTRVARRPQDKWHARWECQCSCGRVVTVTSSSLRSGKSRSCGCGTIESIKRAHTSHGHSSGGKITPTYLSWQSMKRRCHLRARNYGERGIKVCERWSQSFSSFLADMGERPPGTTLDRIRVNEDYEPGNCRWADATVQGNNRRTNRVIVFKGERLTLSQWARRVGMTAQGLRRRLDIYGWTIEEALTTPRSPAGPLSARHH